MANTCTKLSFLTQPDLKKKIVKLYKEGLSYSEIGKKLGGNRNQIAGLVNRIRAAGLIKEVRGKPVAKKPKPQRAPEPKPVLVEDDFDPFFVESTNGEFGKRISILDLQPRQCKYPVHSQGSFHLFCGETDTGDSRYCQMHKDICIVPAKIAPKKHGFRERR